MKLITWNVQWFCGLDGRVDVARVVQHARSMADFDLLCLQEVAVNYPRLRGNSGPEQDQPALLRRLLPGFEVCFGAAVDELADDGIGRRRFGNVIASRLPVLLLQHHALPWPPAAGLTSMPRLAVCATLQAPWGPLRLMTTHLEYESQPQRLAQTRELLRLHAQAVALAQQPPLADDSAGPFRAKPHSADCIVTADFNFDAASVEYGVISGDNGAAPRLHDCWRLVHGDQPQPPTFKVHDSTYGPVPVACDFIFASAGLAPRVRRVDVDGQTRLSDHQPVLVELDDT
jgi:endonuclease/exonuclease/phosphatase family metal-dependent hydrolase